MEWKIHYVRTPCYMVSFNLQLDFLAKFIFFHVFKLSVTSIQIDFYVFINLFIYMFFFVFCFFSFFFLMTTFPFFAIVFIK